MSQGYPEDKEKTAKIERDKKEYKEKVKRYKRDFSQQPNESLDTTNPPKGGSGVWSEKE